MLSKHPHNFRNTHTLHNTHYKTRTYTHPHVTKTKHTHQHITRKVVTNTVQDTYERK
jgi:hypothetical protein